jgi:isopentenyl-diphosphate delta-isomerase
MVQTSEEQVILVDSDDHPLGAMEKLQAHRQGALHRAFSIFLFDREGRLLLQKRAPGKYHSPGLWTNTCCGHPRPGEEVVAAATRRLQEELGIGCPLEVQFNFKYRADLDHGMIEHEIDHVLFGRFDGAVLPAPEEIEAVRWITLPGLVREIGDSPKAFTEWLKTCLPEVLRRRESSGPKGTVAR